MRDRESAPCDDCENGTVYPMGGLPEYVCNRCDAEMTSSRFAAAKLESTQEAEA